MKVTVTLNGTSRNPWERFVISDPFQVPKAEWAAANRILSALDGEPIRDTEDLILRLRGCSEEFVALCVRLFEPGERVKFDIEWPD